MLQPRNKPCHCGSGKQYKKCHGAFTAEFGFKANDSSASPGPQGLEKLLAEQRLMKLRHGDVKPILTESVDGWRFVAIGDMYQISPNCETFTDFLTRYLIGCLGSKWGEDERKLPLAEQHPIVQWFSLIGFDMESAPADERGLHKISLGAATAWFHLAYDLYLIKYNAELQKKLVQRLKLRENFQGARFEAAVAAIMLASGYDLRFAIEKGLGTHPEFFATHRETKTILAVEAKSKHRPGILGFEPHELAQIPESCRIDWLLRAAVEKDTDYPLLVFIEVNWPETIELDQSNKTYGELGNSWAKVQGRDWKDGFPAIGVVFYNDSAPWHLSEPVSRISHSCWALSSSPGVSRHSFDASSLLERIVRGYRQRCAIPAEFPR